MRLSEDWGFYECELDEDVPGMIMVDLGAKELAPLADKPICLEVTVPFLDPDETGFPTSDEAPTLFAIEEQAEALLGEQFGALYVGRVTGEGRRELYYYLAEVDEEQLATSLRALSDTFEGYALEAGNAEDAEWGQYLEMLYPNLIGWRYIENLRASKQLEFQGDPLDLERPVIHTFRFPSEEAALSIAADFSEEDWIETRAVTPDGDEWVVTLVAQQGVELDELNEVTYPMAGISDELGGIYEGWSCEPPTVLSAEETAPFWAWFSAELPRLTASASATLPEVVHEVSEKLEGVHEGLGAVIGGGGGAPFEFVITAHGRKEVARAVEDLVAAAPDPLEGWTVTAFRPPLDDPADMALTLEGESVDVKDVRFQAFRGPVGELGITLRVSDLTPERREHRATAAAILMDHVVGERDSLLIDSLEVEPLEGDDDDVETYGLLELIGLLEQVRAERFDSV